MRAVLRKSIQIITLTLLCAVGVDAAESRTWTNRFSGKTVDAELISVTDDNVRLKRKKDGKMFTFSLRGLSDADKEYVDNFLNPKPKDPEPKDPDPKGLPGYRNLRDSLPSSLRSGSVCRAR